MELLSKLALGFHVATGWPNLLALLAGALLGTLAGLLPRLSPVAVIAMLLPVIPALDATPALIMLAAVCYGARYGGVALTVPRLGIPATFFAACVGTAVMALLALPLAELAFKFGAAETFSLLLLALAGSVVLASGSMTKSLAMGVLGVMLGQLGHDAKSGTPRFLLEIPQLVGGVNFVALSIGMFGCGELIAHLGRTASIGASLEGPAVSDGLRPSRQDFRQAWPAVLRGTSLGAVLGVLPGSGALLASYVADVLERNIARSRPVASGNGATGALAAQAAAMSAGTQTSFIPMLSWGVPLNAVTALLIGALAIKGVQAGPLVMTGKPELFWGLIASMWIGNLVLVILNLPLMGVWRRVLSVPYVWMGSALLLVCCFGVYIAGAGSFNVYLMAFAALMAYVFHKLDCQPAPLMLGFVLGPMMEESLRHALQLSGGEWGVFINRPLSAGLLAAAVLLIVVVLLPRVRNAREMAFKDPR